MIHDRLKEVYDEFDRYCRINNIDFSIDADYYDMQGYRLLNCTSNDIVSVLRHMANFVKDKWVGLDYGSHPVNYEELKNSNFVIQTYNPLFKFTLKSIQEEPLNEDTFKSPNKAYTRRQAAFRSSFRRLKTRDTYEGEKKGKMKKREESLDRSLPFEDRLMSSIHETVGPELSIVEPEVLLTIDQAHQEETDEAIEESIQTESKVLKKYLSLLEQTADETKAALLESLVENISGRIVILNRMLRDKDEPPTP